MTYKERMIELLQHSPTDAMGNHGVGAMADHLMDNGLVFKEMYDDIEERLANQRVRAQTAEFFICKLCENCDYEDHGGITAMTMKCCSVFPECGKFKLRSGWIPVTEREPVIDCLTIDDHGQIELARSISIITLPSKKKLYLANERAYRILSLLGEGDTLVTCTHITHWMPLPERPNE